MRALDIIKVVGLVSSELKAVQLMNGSMAKQFSHLSMVSWLLVIQNHVVNTTVLFAMFLSLRLLGTMLIVKNFIMHFVKESKLKSVQKSVSTNSSSIELLQFYQAGISEPPISDHPKGPPTTLGSITPLLLGAEFLWPCTFRAVRGSL